MANVSYWQGGWASGGSDDLLPGQTHSWIAWGFSASDVVSLTAQPVVGNPDATRILAVENVTVEGDVTGRRMFYNVRNAGPDSIPGYLVNFGYISD
jgi:hypothetical protein